MILATGIGGKNRFTQPNIFLNRAFLVLDLTLIATIDRRVRWTYPPVAFGVLRDLPKWEGG